MGKYDIEAIINDYTSGMTTRQISAKYGCPPSIPSYWAKKLGVSKRDGYGHKITGTKCPKCHKVVSVIGAKFCPFCATSIMLPKDKALEGIKTLFPLAQMLPCGQRDTLITGLNEVKFIIQSEWR